MLGLSHPIQTGWSPIRLGGGGIDRPHPQIVRTVLLSFQELFEPMGAAADQLVGPHQLPSLCMGEVFLAEMHPVSIHE